MKRKGIKCLVIDPFNKVRDTNAHSDDVNRYTMDYLAKIESFCKKYDCDPSSIEGQVRYMINENQFQKVLPEFEGRGYSISQYMAPAYYWLGWGIKGNREYYSYNYSKKLVWA